MFRSILHCLSTLVVVTASLTNAATVTLRSGNGTVGARDSAVSFLLGPANSDFSNAFTQSDFSNAQSGPAAFIVSPNSAWISGLSEDASAKWIGPTANAAYSGNTALYAISFVIPDAFSSATLTMHYAADDTIAFSNGFGGIFLNGTGICTNLIQIGFSQEHTLTCNDIGPLLHVGTNWLYIDTVNLVSGTGLLFSATITTTGTGLPSIYSGGVVNAASFAPGAPVAPGSIAAAFGSFPVASPLGASSLPLPASLAGLSLQFSGYLPTPLFFVSGSQVNLQVPWELAGQLQATVTASEGGQTSAPQAVTLATFAPGIFSMNSQGTGQGAVQDTGFRLVDSSNPATAGDVIQIYCTGLGAVTNQPATGSPAPMTPLAQTITTPTVSIGGSPAQVIFSGLVPTTVGLYQVNAQVPAGAVTGTAVPVVISVGGVTSNSVTIAVLPFPPSPNPLPSITGLSPSSVQVGSGPLTLTINGSGFIPSSSVTYKGVLHSPSLVNSGQLTITLTASDLATAGSFAVVVSNPTPGGGGSNVVNFNVTGSPSNSYTILHSFQGTDGANPYAALTQASDGSFFGTTGFGGNLSCATGYVLQGCGTIFNITSQGAFTTLHSFSGVDGSFPNSALIQGTDGYLYGTAMLGGNLSCIHPGGYGCGVIFRSDRSGGTSTAHAFLGSDGVNPNALIQATNGEFYGTTLATATTGAFTGAVFSMDSSGRVTLLFSFSSPGGVRPNALLQGIDGNFYGTTDRGGDPSCDSTHEGCGTVFKMDPSGSVTSLHAFSWPDGRYPTGLMQGKDGALYGMTSEAGAGNVGTVFRIDPSGNFKVLHSFSGTDGEVPSGSLIQANDGAFYGTTQGGGLSSCAGGGIFHSGECANGTVFRLDAAGNVTLLHVFSGSDGSVPNGLIQGQDGSLYGTTTGGGPASNGVIFRISNLDSLPR